MIESAYGHSSWQEFETVLHSSMPSPLHACGHHRNSGLSEADLMNVRAIFLGTAVCARYPRDSANNYPDQLLSQQQQLLGASTSSSGAAGAPTSPSATSPTAQGSGARQAAAAGILPGIALSTAAMSAAKDEQAEVRGPQGRRIDWRIDWLLIMAMSCHVMPGAGPGKESMDGYTCMSCCRRQCGCVG